MKKLIYVTLVVLSAGALSSFTTVKKDSAKTKHDTVDSRTQLGTADARSAKVAHDKTQLGTAD